MPFPFPCPLTGWNEDVPLKFKHPFHSMRLQLCQRWWHNKIELGSLVAMKLPYQLWTTYLLDWIKPLLFWSFYTLR